MSAAAEQQDRPIVVRLGATEVSIFKEPMIMGARLRRVLPEICAILARDPRLAAFEIDQGSSVIAARVYLIARDGRRRGLEALSGQIDTTAVRAVLAAKGEIASDTWLANVHMTVELGPVRLLALKLETGTPFWLGHAPVAHPARQRWYPLVPKTPTGHETLRLAPGAGVEELATLLHRHHLQDWT